MNLISPGADWRFKGQNKQAKYVLVNALDGILP